MSEALLAALGRRFAAHAGVLPAVLSALESDDPTPFLVRYRRDALQGLPEVAFRKLRHGLREEREILRRRQSAHRALEQAGVLTEDLARAVEETRGGGLLEDLARPRTKAPEDPMTGTARQALAGEAATPIDELLAPYCGPEGAPPTPADQRARLVRLIADLTGEDAFLRQAVRDVARRSGEIATSLAAGGKESKEAYRPFADFRVPLSKIPPRAVLALRRGQKAGVVRARVEVPEEARAEILAGPLAPREGHPYADLLREAALEALDRVLLPAAATEILKERKRAAERSLLPGFAEAFRDRLMMPPAGPVPVVAVAPPARAVCWSWRPTDVPAAPPPCTRSLRATRRRRRPRSSWRWCARAERSSVRWPAATARARSASG